MLRGKSRWYRWTIIVSLIIIMIGGGVIAWLGYEHRKYQAELPGLAQASYDRGRQLLDNQHADRAIAAFEEAIDLSSKALRGIEEDEKRTKSPSQAQVNDWNERRGRTLWVRSQAMRDLVFARAIKDGKPIEQTEDSSNGETFRSFLKIAQADVRNESIACLREAAHRMPKDFAIQQESLRLELLTEKYDWTRIEFLSRNLVAIDPRNVRARYLVARIELAIEMQDVVHPGKAPNRERLDAAREHLAVIKQAPSYPLWRVMLLEARAEQWATLAAAGPRETRTIRTSKKLADLLFHPEQGALARAANRDSFGTLGRFDVEGLIALHRLAIDWGIEEAAMSRASETARLFDCLKAYAVLVDELSANPRATAYWNGMLDTAMFSLAKARRALGPFPAEGWREVRDQFEELARKMADARLSRPYAYALLAQLLSNDAHLEGKQRHLDEKRELEQRATKWIKEGIELARAANEPDTRLVELHTVALEIGGSTADHLQTAAVHIDALKKIGDPRSLAIANLHEAAIFVRQGRLSNAKSSIESVIRNPQGEDVRPRALALYANILLSLQQPQDATAALRQLKRLREQLKQFSPPERAWMEEFLRDPHELDLMLVISELATAVEKIARLKKELLDGAVFEEIIGTHEQNARNALRDLREQTAAHRVGRTAFAAYYLRTGQLTKATDAVRTLQLEDPKSVEALRLKVALLLTPEQDVPDVPGAAERRRREVDRTIESSLESNNSLPAKLLWAEWLIATNRAEQACMYLMNEKEFPDPADLNVKTMLGIAQIQQGNREQGLNHLKELPKTAAIEALLIREDSPMDVREQLLRDAIGKYENNGQFHIMEGERLLTAGKFQESAQAFHQAREFTRVTPQAERGVLRSLLSLTHLDSMAALKLIDRFSEERPNEASLYAVAAYAGLLRGDLGNTWDSWTTTRSMSAALNRWAAAGKQNGMDAASIALFRAHFWQLADQPNRAWAELEPVKPYNSAVLIRMIQLAIDSEDGDKHKIAADLLVLLRQDRKEESFPTLLEARLLAVRGERERAIELLEGLLKREPKYLNAYPLLVRMLNERNLGERAASWTATWLKAAPLDPAAVVESIRIDLVAGKVERATDAAEALIIESVDRADKMFAKVTGPGAEMLKANQLKAVHFAACLALAQAWQDANRLEGAEDFIGRCLKDEPKSLSARLLAAQNALASKDWPKARLRYEQILQDNKDHQIAQTNLAWLLADKLDEPLEGLKVIRNLVDNSSNSKSARIDRMSPDFLDVVGVVYLRAAQASDEKKLLVEMVKIFEGASQRFPDDPKFRLHLAEAYAGLAERSRALATFELALKLAEAGNGRFSTEARKEFIQRVTERINRL